MLKEHSIFRNLTIKYNFWFIKLRYVASLSIPALLFVFGKLFDIKFSSLQIYVILGTSIAIFIVDELFRIIHEKFYASESSIHNPVYFSILQIIFDFICLGILLFFTGGSQSPLLYFFIIHLILAAILLPQRMTYIITGAVSAIIGLYFVAEYLNYVYSHPLMNLAKLEKYGDINHYISVGGVFFALTFFVVYASSKIAGDLYQRERELIEAYEKLENSEKEKQNYVRLIIHELKSPIAAAKSMLNLISSGLVKNDDYEKIIELTKKSENRLDDLLKMINEILKLSRFRLLNEINKEEFEIRQMVLELLDRYKPQIDEKKLNVALISSEPEIKIFADKTLIELCVSNLLNNAIKYNNEEGSVKINIAKNNFLEIEISDTGIGIPQEEIEKIFGGNYRTKDAIKSNIEGSGIGLSTIKQIIEAHGGNIQIFSPSKIAEKNKPGTTIILKLKIEADKKVEDGSNNEDVKS